MTTIDDEHAGIWA